MAMSNLSVEDEQNCPTVIQRDDHTPAPTLASSGSRQDPKDRRAERSVFFIRPSRTPSEDDEFDDDDDDDDDDDYTPKGRWVQVPVKSGLWKGSTVTLRVEIRKIKGKCSVCMTRLTPYLFSTPTGYMSWRMCFKCMKPEERESIKILYPTLNVKDIHN